MVDLGVDQYVDDVVCEVLDVDVRVDDHDRVVDEEFVTDDDNIIGDV